MELLEKLRILANAAKYDVSCSSSGSPRSAKKKGLGNTLPSGICHSWSADGRCITLLKILLTNYCIYDCAYCVNRLSNDLPRALFTPAEVAELTINFYRRNYIEGLFLSSAVFRSPDYTMELLVEVARLLRIQHSFNGYIHLKAIPGCDYRLLALAGRYADRISVNIELPSQQGLDLLAPQKKYEAILKPMDFIKEEILAAKEERKRFKHRDPFVPAGQTTQLIVGATPDSDLKILQLSENLYQRYQLKRVFYSAYVPVSSHPHLAHIEKAPLARENRLYQADWLLRFYGFKAGELLNPKEPNFSLEVDPKTHWALRNLHLFPVEVNRAPYELLLRVPGIGLRSAKRIVAARRVHSLSIEDLKKIGVVLKRAIHFITCRGKYHSSLDLDPELLRSSLTTKQRGFQGEQLTIYSFLSQETVHDGSTVTGEL